MKGVLQKIASSLPDYDKTRFKVPNPELPSPKPITIAVTLKSPFDIKQLLDEVEHDIMNYQNRGLCYLPKPKAEVGNTDTRF